MVGFRAQRKSTQPLAEVSLQHIKVNDFWDEMSLSDKSVPRNAACRDNTSEEDVCAIKHPRWGPADGSSSGRRRHLAASRPISHGQHTPAKRLCSWASSPCLSGLLWPRITASPTTWWWWEGEAQGPCWKTKILYRNPVISQHSPATMLLTLICALINGEITVAW